MRVLRDSVTTALIVTLIVFESAQDGLGGFFESMYQAGKISKESDSMEQMWAAEFEGKQYVPKVPKTTEDPLMALALLTQKPVTGFETTTKSATAEDEASTTTGPNDDEQESSTAGLSTTRKPRRKRTKPTTPTTQGTTTEGTTTLPTTPVLTTPKPKKRRKKTKPTTASTTTEKPPT